MPHKRDTKSLPVNLTPLRSVPVKFKLNKIGEIETPNLRKEETKNEESKNEDKTSVVSKTTSTNRREMFKSSTSNGSKNPIPV